MADGQQSIACYWCITIESSHLSDAFGVWYHGRPHWIKRWSPLLDNFTYCRYLQYTQFLYLPIYSWLNWLNRHYFVTKLNISISLMLILQALVKDQYLQYLGKCNIYTYFLNQITIFLAVDVELPSPFSNCRPVPGIKPGISRSVTYLILKCVQVGSSEESRVTQPWDNIG